MCLITGGINLTKEEIVKMIITGKHRGPDSFGVWSDGLVIKSEDFSEIKEIRGGNVVLAQCRLAMTGSKNYTQPFYNDIVLVHNGEIYNHESLRKWLIERGASFESDVDSEVILRLLEYFIFDKKMKVEEAVKKAMLMLRGDYAVAFALNGKIYLFRDPIGVRPLYYSPRGRFGSEKKVLWSVGEEAIPVNPGELVKLPEEEKMKLLSPWDIKGSGKGYYDGLKNLLQDAVRIRTAKKVGVLFSGGLDSSLIALLASKYSKVVLYTAGTEDSKDVEWARKVSDELRLELREYIFTREEVEREIKNVMFAIEEPNPMNLAIAIPLYFATKLARKDDVKVLLSGQGADELFGGYAKYLENPSLMRKDIEEIAERNLGRDDKVGMLNGVEVRYPYLDLPFVSLALRVPLEEKIREGVRKAILRRIALDFGLPEEVAFREKKAAQYGSNAQKILSKIAKKSLREFAQKLFSEVFST